MGAEEREQVALFSASGADGAETREQPSRESSAVRGSEEGRGQPEKTQAFRSTALLQPNLKTFYVTPSQSSAVRHVCKQRGAAV